MKGNYTSRFEATDNVMTTAEFRQCVEDEVFVDSDGFGSPARDGKVDDDIWIRPSCLDEQLPKDATHVVWYNN